MNCYYNKINLILIFFFIFFSSINEVEAHYLHYEKLEKIEMEIFRNNKKIGYNHYFFKKKKNFTFVTNETKISLKLLGTVIFKLESSGKEKYYKDELISFNSKTLQNDKKKFVNLIFDKKINKFLIKGSSYNGKADKNNVIGNWWNHNLLKTDTQISPLSGSIKKQVVTFIANEEIEIYNKTYDTEHYTIKSKNPYTPDNKKLNFSIWIDKKTSLILKVKYSKMGSWEYRLKNYN